MEIFIFFLEKNQTLSVFWIGNKFKNSIAFYFGFLIVDGRVNMLYKKNTDSYEVK